MSRDMQQDMARSTSGIIVVENACVVANMCCINHRKLWDHMTKMAAVLSEVSSAMNRMSSSQYLSVKELLSSSMWKYAHQCPQQKHVETPPPVVLSGDSDYKEHFNIAGTHK